MHTALFQEIEDQAQQVVRCRLCPHECVIEPSKTGRCGVRQNIKGVLYTTVYSRHTSVGMDPIEKKPLYHFYPGSQILSVGTFGCNLSCGFCQNWEISQSPFDEHKTQKITSEEALRLAKEYNSIGIAYTYNEPFINYEWVMDTARLFHEQGLVNVLVSNGYVNEEPLTKILPFIHAANIDVKSFHNGYYQKICRGSIGPVLRTVEIMVKHAVHVELTHLVVPQENDSEQNMKDLVDWISALNPSIPLHLSRYYPQHTFKRPPTALKTLEILRDIAVKELQYVYIGNAWEKGSSHTYCRNRDCNNVLISRTGYSAKVIGLDYKLCKKCSTENNITW